MLQYKLIHALDDISVSQIKKKFKEEEIYFFTNYIIGIKYSFKLNNYSEVLKKLVGMNVKQYTFTSYRFKKLIQLAFKKNLFLGSIEFIDLVDENINYDYINKYISSINNTIDKIKKETISDEFFKELNWVMVEDCIDIKSISFKISIEEYPFESTIRIFNNGVIYLDSDKVFSELENLIAKIK
ncbi:hypothetical protein [Paraclostridium bifermentans]|uniref:hypothetical protein n=1 Tax=Paraclostridium bifermentans TaxID=1490 RepID=UPI00359C7CE9